MLNSEERVQIVEEFYLLQPGLKTVIYKCYM